MGFRNNSMLYTEIIVDLMEEKTEDKKPFSIVVGNISYTATEDDISAELSRYGNILSNVIPKYPNGRSKGLAIVKFENEEDAKEAIRILDQTELLGRKVFLYPAEERPPKPRDGFRENRNRGGRTFRDYDRRRRDDEHFEQTPRSRRFDDYSDSEDRYERRRNDYYRGEDYRRSDDYRRDSYRRDSNSYRRNDDFRRGDDFRRDNDFRRNDEFRRDRYDSRSPSPRRPYRR